MSRRNRDRARFWTAAALLSAAVFGCAAKESKTGTIEPEPAAQTADVGPPPSEAEALAFAASLAEAAKASDFAAMRQLLDMDAVLQQATAGIGTPATQAAFAREFMSRLDKRKGYLADLAHDAKSGATIRALRTRMDGPRRAVLIRLLFASGGVSYADYQLIRVPGGEVRAIDCYIYHAGENLSATVRRMYTPLAIDANRGSLAKAVGAESEFAQAMPRLQEMSNAIREGRPGEALDIYAKLPPTVRKDKILLLQRFRAAQALNDEPQYLAAMDDLRKYYPDDGCIDLITLDGLFLRKQYDKLFAALERLDKSIGGDPYLGVVKASTLLECGRYDEARAAAKAAVAAEPTLEPGYNILMRVGLAAKRFDEVAANLRVLRDKFQTDPKAIENDPDFAPFLKSPEYRDLMKDRAKP